MPPAAGAERGAHRDLALPRASARDSSRLATFAHAISSTQPTDAIRTSSERRTSPTTCSCSGTMLKVRPPLGGYTAG